MPADADHPSFVERLRQLRTQHCEAVHHPGLDPAGFARLIGIDPARYAAAEAGTAEPDLAMLARLHEKTGISLDWLIVG